MRPLLTLLLLTTTPAFAWQAGSDGTLCTLEHAENGTFVLLTYDPSGPVYTITVTRPEPWADSAFFGIGFQGGRELTISTDRHQLSADDRSVTVTDRGFGNVLRGLAGNVTATAFTETGSVTVSLTGAAPEVAAFEDCGAVPAV